MRDNDLSFRELDDVARVVYLEMLTDVYGEVYKQSVSASKTPSSLQISIPISNLA